jgi:hypothetical protein
MAAASATKGPTDTPPAGTAPRVELGRTMSGAHTWRVVVAADDGSASAMDTAVATAVRIDADLAQRYSQA